MDEIRPAAEGSIRAEVTKESIDARRIPGRRQESLTLLAVVINRVDKTDDA